MRDPKNSDQMDELKKDIDYNRSHGIVDDYKELDYLRLQKQNGKIDQEEYEKQLNERIKETQKHFDEQKRNGTLDEAEKTKVMDKLNRMVYDLPGSAKLEALRTEHACGMMDDANYDLQVGWQFAQMKKQRDKDITAGTYDSDKKEAYEKAVAELKTITDEMPADRRQKVEDYVTKYSKD